MSDVLQLLRTGLLDGRPIAVASPARAEIADALTALGAEVQPLVADHADEPAVEQAVRALSPVEVLVVDAAAAFDAAQPQTAQDELAPLRAAADGAWVVARAVANAAWIEREAPGKLVLLAPKPGAGPHAEATRAALENLSRTLSIEWSRFGIRTTTITPGDETAAQTEAALVAYLASPAGDYFSGSRLDLS